MHDRAGPGGGTGVLGAVRLRRRGRLQCWSGLCNAPAEVEEWQRRHAQETRHTRCRRNFADYAVMEPPR
ncbi:hypothetical protein [Streptomyces sp. NPDC058256]|uniref:hypothetical protein n=1 Tax=Streptomyces sp. NPDC058256 TaxID=3346408 RepID=UPI0036E372EA